MVSSNINHNARIIVVQKLYSYYINKDSLISYPKHRYKKFIKDIVSGTIEREEFILAKLREILKQEFIPTKPSPDTLYFFVQLWTSQYT